MREEALYDLDYTPQPTWRQLARRAISDARRAQLAAEDAAAAYLNDGAKRRDPALALDHPTDRLLAAVMRTRLDGPGAPRSTEQHGRYTPDEIEEQREYAARLLEEEHPAPGAELVRRFGFSAMTAGRRVRDARVRLALAAAA